MTSDPINKVETSYVEAPASWNTGYVTPNGFVCRITLRGESGKDLLEKANAALTFLVEHGCVPERRSVRNTKSSETRQCPIHNHTMRRYEKNGKSWFSHKTEDGKWCCGKDKSEAHYV